MKISKYILEKIQVYSLNGYKYTNLVLYREWDKQVRITPKTIPPRDQK